jgi:hypothetical protein
MCVGITTKDSRRRIINFRSQLAHTDSLRLPGSVISGRLGSGSVRLLWGPCRHVERLSLGRFGDWGVESSSTYKHTCMGDVGTSVEDSFHIFKLLLQSSLQMTKRLKKQDNDIEE